VAQTVSARGVQVKIRNPWLAFLWAIVTFGIYYLYWYYVINRDLNDYGARLEQGENPLRVSAGVALLAVSLGAFLIVPPFISMWRTMRRIARAQELAGVEDRLNHVLGFVLFLIALIFFPVEIPYAQHHLNKIWQLEAEEGAKREMGMRGVASQA
jgi:hypothetical protein